MIGLTPLSLTTMTSYKKSVICYMLSHVNSCNLLPMKLSLLQSLEEVTSAAKVQMLLPVAEKLADDAAATAEDAKSEIFVALVLGSLDGSAADALNERSGKAWEAYQKIIRHFFQNGRRPLRYPLRSSC